MQTFIIVNAEVHDKSTGKTRQSERWYISSLGLNAKEALKSIRSHWQVESMHWTLDMTFKEDGSRIRRGHGAEMMNVFRKIALNLVKHESSKNASMKRKLKMAALDDNYLSAVISSAIKML